MSARPDSPEAITFADLVAEHAAADSDRLTYIFERGDEHPEERVTAGDLALHGNQLAWALQQEGLGRGDRVAVMMRNHPEFLYALAGLSQLGAIAVPVDPRARDDVLRHYLQRVGTRAVIAADYVVADEGARAVMAESDVVPYAVGTPEGREEGVDVGGVADLTEVLTGAEKPDVGRLLDTVDFPWALHFTSGTTGPPKPIVVSYLRMAHYRHFRDYFDLRPDDVPYTGLSFAHGNALRVTMLPSLFGHTSHSVFSRWFTTTRLWDVCRRYGCTTWSNLGGIATAVFAKPPSPLDREHKVRQVTSAGMPRDLREPFEERFGVKVLEQYGTTEAGVVAVNRPGEGPPGSFGRALPDQEVAIIDDAGHHLGPGEVGHLIVRSRRPDRFEYYGDPEATAAKYHGDWLRTGDLCSIDADGWLFFSHRDEEGGVRRLGEFISTDSIMRTIAGFPEVSDVHVYGIPDPSGAPGESLLVAAVIPAADGTFDPQRVLSRCTEELKNNARPALLQVLDEFPLTPTAKVQTRHLRTMLDERPETVFPGA